MEEILKQFKAQLASILESLKSEIGGVRTNRPSPGLIEDVKVTYYNQTTPIKHLGSVGVTLPREIHVTVWDQAAVSAVAKAIEISSLGLTPQVQGNMVRVFLPELSEERRQEFVRHVKKITEDHRIKIRHARDEANKKIEKSEEEGGFSEDQTFAAKEQAQKAVDKTNEEIEKILEMKVKEIAE
jgi:ribosome recycling factor